MEQKSGNKNLVFFTLFAVFILCLSFFTGLAGAFLGTKLLQKPIADDRTGTGSTVSVLTEDSAIIDVAEKTSPSVVSIVISKDLPVYEDYYFDPFNDGFSFPGRRQVGTEEQQVGAGTGFIVSAEGMIVTNRHVVSDEDANYTVVLNDGSQLEATVLGRDRLLDIAILKVEPDSDLPFLGLGDSDSIRVGQNVIAIGNSLGRFSNTVSLGIISGLARSITASDSSGQGAERLEGVIQTDASINPGNSGGPLLDIAGNVIGVNVAIAADAENIGFAIPINAVKPAIESVEQTGELQRAFLGVRYRTITPQVAEELELSVTQGAIIVKGDNGEPGVTKGSAAEAAGLQEGDIITALNDIELDRSTSLQIEIQKRAVGDEIKIKYLRDGQERFTSATLTKLPD